jgi:hypothetical protein
MLEKQLKEHFLSKQISLKIRKLKFSVYGKERYEVEKYDTFFIEDLSPFLKSINVPTE